MTDMDVAVTRILRAIKDGENIIIYSDYDCDGIPGGVALHDFFVSIGFENFENYIPHRHEEGFGFNEKAVEKFKESGAALIITIDCGTSDLAAAKAAKEAGIDVIITDHHEPGAELPDVHALLNPKRDDAYPFRGLCGAGVVYKLVQALIIKGKETGAFNLKEGQEKWLLDMVGLATIADMVPLVGENRALAHYGLTVLRKSRRPGLHHLFRKTRTNQRYLTEDDIGFTLGPRINAASRMDTPEDAFHMLATQDEEEAGTRVLHLEKLNNERKGVVAAMVKDAKRRLEKLEALPAVIVMGDPSWRPSLVGLVANTLAETYKRPAFLWGRDGQGMIKGSCRSGGGSLTSLMEAAGDHFLEAGGHEGAGGFSVAADKIHTLADALEAVHTNTKKEGVEEMHEAFMDADLSLEDVTDSFVRSLGRLAPFGEANAKPLFRFKEVTPARVEVFGKTKNHTRVVFETAAGTREAIAFFREAEDFVRPPKAGAPLTLIAHVEESFFMGRREIRLRIVEIV